MRGISISCLQLSTRSSHLLTYTHIHICRTEETDTATGIISKNSRMRMHLQHSFLAITTKEKEQGQEHKTTASHSSSKGDSHQHLQKPPSSISVVRKAANYQPPETGHKLPIVNPLLAQTYIHIHPQLRKRRH